MVQYFDWEIVQKVVKFATMAVNEQKGLKMAQNVWNA